MATLTLRPAHTYTSQCHLTAFNASIVLDYTPSLFSCVAGQPKPQQQRDPQRDVAQSTCVQVGQTAAGVMVGLHFFFLASALLMSVPCPALLARIFQVLDIWLRRLFCFIELLCHGLSRVVSVPLQAPCVLPTCLNTAQQNAQSLLLPECRV